jgi:predicted Zn-dependent protease
MSIFHIFAPRGPRLNIVPVSYRGRKTRELAEMIVSPFGEALHGYRIHRPVEAAEAGVRDDIRSEPGTGIDKIHEGQLFRFLERYPAPRLAVTSFPVVDDGDIIRRLGFGAASKSRPTAYITEQSADFGSMPYEAHSARFLEAFAKIGAHEVGHLFDLVGPERQHHEGDASRRCLMQTTTYNMEMGYDWVSSDQKWFGFCGECRERLARYKGF